ncbi:MAG TPA: hypothetical protein VHR45_21280 [Thermoanaerobaculia bacterium]|nr:hypothetical protein [Thermoanaerobaculia bacterium]
MLEARRPSSPAPRTAIAAALLAAAVCAACGKQGPPTPPLRYVPAPTKDLAAHQRGPLVVLSFTYPQTTPGGIALNGISKVEVWEAAQAAPPLGAVRPLDPRLFGSLAKKRLTLASTDLGAASLGSRLLIDLPLPQPLPAAPQAHFFEVKTFGPKGDASDYSNQASVVARTPPAAPPDGIEATGQADGVLVEWKPVAGAGGYNVYRRRAEERLSAQPLARVQPTEKSMVDSSAAFGQRYIYSVTTIDAKDPQVESAVGSEREIRYVDRFPPPVPADLVGVGDAGRVRLVWRASEAPDLAGYIVYRQGAQGGFIRLTEKPVQTTDYIDTGAVAGQTYLYRVTAIDQAGNESAPSAAARVVVP